MEKIKIAIVGVGNCVSSLIQGLHYYRGDNLENAIGLMHCEIGEYKPEDIEAVAAFDIDKRKVGVDLNRAIFAKPNCTTVFCPDLPESGVTVRMGKVLDGYAAHMRDYDDESSFLPSDAAQPSKEEVVKVLM